MMKPTLLALAASVFLLCGSVSAQSKLTTEFPLVTLPGTTTTSKVQVNGRTLDNEGEHDGSLLGWLIYDHGTAFYSLTLQADSTMTIDGSGTATITETANTRTVRVEGYDFAEGWYFKDAVAAAGAATSLEMTTAIGQLGAALGFYSLQDDEANLTMTSTLRQDGITEKLLRSSATEVVERWEIDATNGVVESYTLFMPIKRTTTTDGVDTTTTYLVEAVKFERIASFAGDKYRYNRTLNESRVDELSIKISASTDTIYDAVDGLTEATAGL
jgi:hypothetical protein